MPNTVKPHAFGRHGLIPDGDPYVIGPWGPDVDYGGSSFASKLQAELDDPTSALSLAIAAGGGGGGDITITDNGDGTATFTYEETP